MNPKKSPPELKTTNLELSLPVSYLLEQQSQFKQGIQGNQGNQGNQGLLVLHGFEDHARAVRKRLLGIDPLPEFTVFTPNGMFPAPIYNGTSYKEAYAWYFKDPHSHVEMISPEFAANSLIKLIHQLELGSLEWTILGFSQGGFFAPFMIRQGLNAKKIISVCAAYRPENYRGLDIELHAIHGERDEVVPCEVGQSSLESVKKEGLRATFTPLPGVGHTLDDAGRALVRSLLLGHS